MSAISSPTVVEAGLPARPRRARVLTIPVAVFDRPALWLAAGAAIGVGVAGMWNVRAIDGLGVAAFVVPLVGPFQGKAAQFAAFGPGFGALFAVAAGLAATATASSLATFTLLPGLASSAGRIPRASALKVPAIMAALVATVGALYGAFIGRMGPEGAAAFNTSAIRSAQSFVVFGTLGSLMLVWAAFEARLLAAPAVGVAPIGRIFLARPAVKAAIAGAIAGGFTLGRPLAVFREFLLYAAQPGSVLYGAGVMALQSVATMAIPIGLLACTVVLGYGRLNRWTCANPRRSALVSAAAMAAGGAFLIFYWAITRVWPWLGRWGFQLGLYQ